MFLGNDVEFTVKRFEAMVKFPKNIRFQQLFPALATEFRKAGAEIWNSESGCAILKNVLRERERQNTRLPAFPAA